MLRHIFMGLVLGGLALSARVPTARGQDEDEKKALAAERDRKYFAGLLTKAEEEYRLFFRRPEKVHEYWAAMRLEMKMGKFDLAALHMKWMLDLDNPGSPLFAVDPRAKKKEMRKPLTPEQLEAELLKIEQVETLGAFIRLKTVRTWSSHPPFQKEAEANVDRLIQRVTKALDAYLGNEERIRKFIGRLDAPTVEERNFAFVLLQRSGVRAVPLLLEALEVNHGKPLGNRVREALLRFPEEMMVPLLEVLKARDAEDARTGGVRLEVLDLFRRRGDDRCVPYLWHLAGPGRRGTPWPYPAEVRAKAAGMLSMFLETAPEHLPPGHMALTKRAEDFLHHRVRFPADAVVRLWPWNGKKLAAEAVELTPRQAEEFFGLRHAREALDLDPAYRPAQHVFLRLTLQRTLEPDLQKALLRPLSPSLNDLLAKIDADLLMEILEEALDEGDIASAVGCIQALGQRGETRAARLAAGGSPRGLVRALHYPDRRVQWSALEAMLWLPQTAPPVASVRIVELLRRHLRSDGTARALVLFAPEDKAADLRKSVQAAGLLPTLAASVKEGFAALRESPDFDLAIVHPPARTGDLPFVLAQLRGDQDAGRLPILLAVPKDQVKAHAKIARRYGDIVVIPDLHLGIPEEVKRHVEGWAKEPGREPLTLDERLTLRNRALGLLWRMARGELQGYDVRPAREAIAEALRLPPDQALLALESLSKLPGPDVQQRLASLVLDPGKGKLRVPAAIELNLHMQRHGVLLGKDQLKELQKAYAAAGPEDPVLRNQLALVLGSLRPGTSTTGSRLLEFRPDPPPPPPMEKGKEKAKEKE